MKKVGGAIYVHKSAVDTLPPEALKKLEAAASIFSVGEWLYDVVKVAGERVSFIRCSDWDTVHEPRIDHSYCINLKTKRVKRIQGGGQVYHHKWMFVKSDYTGFDVESNKKRSEMIENELKRLKIDRKFIGFEKNWNVLLQEMQL